MRHRSPRPPLDIRHLRPLLAELVSRVAAAGVRSFRAVVAGAAALLLGGTSMVTGSLASDDGGRVATDPPQQAGPAAPLGGGGGQTSTVPSPSEHAGASDAAPASPTIRRSPSLKRSASRPAGSRPSGSDSPDLPSIAPPGGLPPTATSAAPSTTAGTPESPDTTPPSTTVTTTWATRNSWVVALAADEVATFQCSFDGGAYRPCAATLSYVDLGPGRHTLDVRATDLAGNTDPSPAEVTWTPALDMTKHH